MSVIKELEKEYIKKNLPEIRSGDTVRIHLKIKEKDKERIQVFEGIVIKRRGGSGLSGTFTVRKIAADGIGVERTFFLHFPFITKIQILKKGKVRRAQLYYLRHRHLRSLKLKERKEYQGIKEWEEVKKEEKVEEKEEKKEEEEKSKTEEKTKAFSKEKEVKKSEEEKKE